MQNYYRYNNQLVTKNTMLTVEKKYISQNNIKSYDLMKKAGSAFAKIIIGNFPKSKVLFICGKGGNGGDGLISACILKKKGWPVSFVLTDIPKNLSKDTSKALDKLKLSPQNFSDLKIKSFDLIVDAIFGIGISRKITGIEKSIISKINSSKVPIIAIDIPSGVNSDTGEIMGVATNCSFTVTFSRAKIGNILLPGYKNNGHLKIVNIGIPNSYFSKYKPEILTNIDKIWKNKIIFPKIDAHKYLRGYTLIIGGPKSMTGASRLAALAAQRAGSGIVVVAVSKNSENIYFSSLTSQIIKSYRNLKEFRSILDDPRINSIVIGPGLGQGKKTISKMKIIFERKRRAVIDADAISSFQNNIDLLKKITSGSDIVYTPHEGELLKLFPNIKGNAIEKSIYAANNLNSTFVLKGPNTLVSNKKTDKIIVNIPGARWLATAGSGDILAGIIGALMATGVESFTSAGLGVYIHSESGKVGGPGMIAEDLINIMPSILKKLL